MRISFAILASPISSQEWLAVNPGARPAAQAGAAFLTLHALVHL
jgi:hypothetical protein